MSQNRQHTFRALQLLTTGLYPYVEQGLKKTYKQKWHDEAMSSFRDDRTPGGMKGNVIHWDAHNLLTVLWDQWNRVFRQDLRQTERSLVAELRDFRNRWAHQEEFNFDDTYRVLDSAHRLLRAVGAKEAEEVERLKHDLMRDHVNRQVREAYRKTQIRTKTWKDLIIYAVCCVSLVFVVLYFFGWPAWFLSLFVVAVFIYLSLERIKAPPLLFHGPRECFDCGKIIYNDRCPYCDVVPTQPASEPDQSEQAADIEADNSESSQVESVV